MLQPNKNEKIYIFALKPHNFFSKQEALYSLECVWFTKNDHGEKEVPQKVLPMSVSCHGCHPARAELCSEGSHLPSARVRPGSTSTNRTSAMGPLIFAIPSLLPESRVIRYF